MKYETTVGLRQTRHGGVAGRGGFTTMEMLIAVAILVILFALMAPNLISAQRSLRQKELDAKAETIYAAVQNQLVKLRASGHKDRCAMDKNTQLLVRAADSGTEALVGLGIPNDMQPQYDEEGKLVQNLHYVTKLNDSAPNAQGSAIMTQKTVDAELLANHWIIEYDPTNCNVFAVFYSETKDLESEYAANWSEYDQYRERTNDAHTGRFDKGAWVGYYGGDVASSTKTTSQLVPTMTVTNAEKLMVSMRCTNTTGLSLGQLDFRLDITDGEGNHWYKSYKVSPFGTLYRLGPIMLDDLSSEYTRFNYLFNGTNPTNYGPLMNPGSQALTPGSKLAIRLTVSSTNNSVEEGTFGPVYTHSLYADSSTTTTAHIEFGRHLQNLDESAYGTSFATTEITKAEQRSDVSFKDDEESNSDWYTYYSDDFFNGTANHTANFKPISNQKLEKYDGKSYRIAGLNVSAATNAALFEHVQGGVELKDMHLAGSYVRATAEDGCAAALVGSSSATGSAKNTIDGCYAYLEPADYRGKDNTYAWVQGADAGGLVGNAQSGNLEIKNSLASTVINGTSRAGGLVGYANGGSITMDTSYADSYLTGAATGGLAVGDVASLANCYAAGYQTATGSAAGLVNGAIASSNASYTICAMGEKQGQSSAEFAIYSTARSIETKAKTYYFVPSSKSELNISDTTAIGTMSNTALTTALGAGKFTSNSAGQTSPYKLMGQSLSAYTYPRLKGIRHYGDWQTEFEPGALVYYEKYQDGTYGFDGAGVDEKTLKDDVVVVGDGYGIVYKASDSIPTTITVKVGTFDAYSIDTTKPYKVTGADGVEYYIYPLPTSIVDADLASAGTGYTPTSFYQRVKVTTSVANSDPEYFYFNPYFAKTAMRSAKDEEAPALSGDEEIFVRTPRHLYALSLYYDTYYRGLTAQNVYTQERDLNYSRYAWKDFSTRIAAGSDKQTINSQGPIGGAKTTSFVAEYNGGCHIIEDVSFESVDGYYVGMFGYVDKNSFVHDVVLATQYDPEHSENHFLVKRVNNMGRNDVVYMGVLVGCNEGHIENCATAGYYLAGYDGTLHTYANSTLYAGGLVGCNEGVIRNCSADTPAIRLSSLYSEVRLGGFVGWNTGSGSIYDCYALGYLEVAESRGGNGVNASGFAGYNDGTVNGSYCATAIVTNGEAATSYGFAPGEMTDMQVTNCYYMDRGTYFYVNSLRSYNSVTSRTSATPFNYDLENPVDGTPMTGTKADASHSKYHGNTITGEGEPEAYPFRTVVVDADGNPVHYGEWINGPAMGDTGIFYWEHEEGGSNSGYHITYVGTAEEGQDSGTSLCTAHDDGGRITDFGYGYYVRAGQESHVKITAAKGLASSVGVGNGPGTYNTSAANVLHEQMNRYTFYPYTTRYISDPGDGEDFIYLDNAGDGNYNRRSGTWTLSIVREGSLNAVDYTYEITPFFANAIQRRNAQSHINVTASDWRTTDYSQKPGESDADGGNPYEIRTVQQLEYINWNHEQKNCSTLVYGEKENMSNANFQQFPFLQYATVLKTGTQTRNAAEAERSAQAWVQSHDLLGKEGSEKENVTPIAGMATSTKWGKDYSSYLYAWFGGSYDGQSYKIQNIKVVSEAYTVGLFGVTAGANIKNIIMYANDYDETTEASNEYSRIERLTESRTGVYGGKVINFETAEGAYNIGGLVGIAYEYKSSVITNKIKNCAIAGYRVIDRSTNKQGAGSANIGGLVGLANVNLEQCSAVTEIVIACRHDNGHMYYGSYERVAGLAGSAGAPEATLAINDCYTGGTIVIDGSADDPATTLGELPLIRTDGDGFAVRDQSGTGHSNNIFVSGMIGGSYASYISNFTNKEGSVQPDGKATINNCYTYVQLPNLEGTVRAVSLFASQGDRYNRNSSITVTNCHYLSTIKDNIQRPHQDEPSTWPTYFFEVSKGNSARGKVNSVPTDDDWANMLQGDDENLRQTTINKFKGLVISDDEFEQMLNGDLTCLQSLLNKQSSGTSSVPKVIGDASPITFADLSSIGKDVLNGGRADGPWSTVDTVDRSGADITGKYSFSSDASQEGKDYPFPTVIRQKDITYSTPEETNYVNVHYGRWPLSGWRWSKGRASMDIFDNMGADGYAQQEFVLQFKEAPSTEPTTDSFTIDPVDKAEVVGVRKGEDNSSYIVTIRALRDGYAIVTEGISETSASFVLDITAKLKLQSEPTRLTLYNGDPVDIAFMAKSSGNKDYATAADASWSVTTVEDEDSDYFIIQRMGQVNEWQVTSDALGSHALMATYTYDYHTVDGGKTFVERLSIPTKTLGYVGLSTGDELVLGGESETNSTRAYRQRDPVKVSIEEVNLGIAAPSAAQLFLFASAEDGDFGSFLIGEAEVEAANDGDIIDPSEYQVSFANSPQSQKVKDTVTGNYYRRWIGYVRYVGTQEPVPVRITVPVTDPVSGLTYSLYTVVSGIPNRIVHFEPGAVGVEGTMEDIALLNNDPYVAPECGYSKMGYTFDGWIIQGAEEQKYSPENGDVIPVDGFTTVVATWRPNAYTVAFDANGGTGKMQPMNLEYDGEWTPLTANEFERDAYEFVEWNMAADGSGASLEDGELVQNLTATDGDAITLYAQWRLSRKLNLVSYDSGSTSWLMDKYVGVGGSSIGTAYVAPSVTGWTLDGWYTRYDADAIQILDAAGAIVAEAQNVEGYTANGEFSYADEATLYARWSRTDCYVQVDKLEHVPDDDGIYHDDGMYIIASGSAVGTQKLLSVKDGNSLYGRNIEIRSGGEHIIDSRKNQVDAFVTETITDDSLWSIAYLRDHNENYYLISTMVDTPTKYLTGNKTALQLRNDKDAHWNGLFSNKVVWTFGLAGSNLLQCENQLYEEKKGFCLYWGGSSWKHDSPNKESYLFKQCDVVYTFYPDPIAD